MMKVVTVVAVLAAGAVFQQDVPMPAKPGAQHEWLQQLVGQWSVTCEASMGPGTEPMMIESTETVRSIGGLWIQGEGSAVFDGKPFTSILTLGYDPRQKAFVGTWIDTMQTHLWTYRGSLDDAKKVLTLEAEGPAFDDPNKNSKYRDVIEVVGKDHRRLSSSVQGEDGQWTTFMRADYHRKKP
jgi:hypothetical protein